MTEPTVDDSAPKLCQCCYCAMDPDDGKIECLACAALTNGTMTLVQGEEWQLDGSGEGTGKAS
jgi:hypothetical protein